MCSLMFFFFSSRRRHTILVSDWSSDVCSSDLHSATPTPYVLTGVGVALCFRARVINIGGEGQIALGGLAATWIALSFPQAPGVRSEERRVGKEGRTRGGAGTEQKRERGWKGSV